MKLNYFLFENYDADAAAPGDDPRRLMNADTTAVLARILGSPRAAEDWETLRALVAAEFRRGEGRCIRSIQI